MQVQSFQSCSETYCQNFNFMKLSQNNSYQANKYTEELDNIGIGD